MIFAKNFVPLRMFFSIVITTYNAESFLVEALNSLKNQTFQDFECIITDDFSTDKTLEICKQWLSENPNFQTRTKIIESTENTGVSANTNRGLKAASCEWIQVLSADDTFPKGSLEKAHKFILENPDCTVFQGIAAIYNDDFSAHNFDKFVSQDLRKSDFFTLSAEQQYQQLLRHNRIIATAVFYKKSAVEHVGFCDENIPMIDDWPLWLKLTRNGYKFYFLNDIVVNYRIHKQAVSKKNKGLFFSEIHLRNRPIYEQYVFPNLPFFERYFCQFKYAFKRILLLHFNSEKNWFARSVLAVLRFFKRRVFRIKSDFSTKNPKHIAVFVPNFEINGPMTVCANYTNVLIKHGYSVDVVVANSKGFGKDIFPKQATIVNLGDVRVRHSIGKLRRYLKKTPVSTLICFGDLSSFAGLLATFGLRKQLNLVVSQHGFTADFDEQDLGFLGKIIPFFRRKFYPLANRIIAISNGVFEDLKKRKTPAEKISIVPNFIDKNHIEELAKQPISQELPKDYILFVGRLARVKNIQLLIDAMEFLDENLHLVVVGAGLKPAPTNRVHFIGEISNVLPIIKNAKTVAIPSFSETLSMVAIEAATLGKTVVHTPNSGCMEIFGTDGSYCSKTFDDPKAFAETLKKALENPINTDILDEKIRRFEEASVWPLLEKVVSNSC